MEEKQKRFGAKVNTLYANAFTNLEALVPTLPQTVYGMKALSSPFMKLSNKYMWIEQPHSKKYQATLGPELCYSSTYRCLIKFPNFCRSTSFRHH